MPTLDPHSYTDLTQGHVEFVDLRLRADFDSRRLIGQVTVRFSAPLGDVVDLDTRSLRIGDVFDENGRALPSTLSPSDPIKGARLRIEETTGVQEIRISYETSPEASALQWLEPTMTAGGVHPFLFSQCQAIHARSLLPMQDSPRVRVRFRAELTVPDPLVAVMAAAANGRQPGSVDGTTTWLFDMPQPIPSYLIALAVGNLKSAELSRRSRVWAEPETLEHAAWEFAEVEEMMSAAESMFGAYEWERYDLLVMPPSFPYGGMENPRLTFLTPTLIAKDRSLVSVLAHELAHSWTGNLVTNASMNDFWLNEGFTVYAERRILERVCGRDLAIMNAAIGRTELEETMVRLGQGSPYSRLRTDLEGVDPDAVFSLVPYEKGFLFLVALERAVGRERFDQFLSTYIDRFRFQSLTTEEFEEFLKESLPEAVEKVDIATWLYETDLPEGAPEFECERLEAIEKMAKAWGEGTRPPADIGWNATDWLLYLHSIPTEISLDDCHYLDDTFQLTKSENYEVLVSWLTRAIASGYSPALERVESVLTSVGRLKFLKPLYSALASRPETARDIFDKAQGGYHPIARQGIESQLAVEARTDRSA